MIASMHASSRERWNALWLSHTFILPVVVVQVYLTWLGREVVGGG
jgi:hypothetical protein